VRTVLETARLILREMEPEDAGFIGSLLADPDVMRFYPRRYVEEGADPWIKRQVKRYETDGHGLWLLLARDGGAPVGQAGLVMQEVEGTREAEIGYMVQRSSWGWGYATEAASAIRDHAVERLCLARLISLIHPENVASQRVAIKLGMNRERRTLLHGAEHILFSRGKE
jgi:[ribosomal protein S5]-alanine N-acetyltransferase